MTEIPANLAGQIQVLSGTAAIRARPAMYLGSLDDPLAGTRLLQESLCLALDAACCGSCTRIAVTLHPDGSSTVADDGPGLSLEPSLDGRPEAELLMTELFACRERKDDARAGQVACGVGIAVMNALSEWCVLTTSHEGARWSQRYQRGIPLGPFEKVRGDTKTGTTIEFKPDLSILPNAIFDVAVLSAWFKSLDLPIAKVEIRLIDLRTTDVAGPSDATSADR